MYDKQGLIGNSFINNAGQQLDQAGALVPRTLSRDCARGSTCSLLVELGAAAP